MGGWKEPASLMPTPQGRAPESCFFKALSFRDAFTIPIFTYCVLTFGLTLKIWWGAMGAALAGTPIFQ